MLWRETNPALNAIIIVTLGYTAFSFADTVTKWLSQGFSVHQILLTSSFVGLTITSVWVLAQKGWRGFITPRLRWHLWRGFCGCFVALFVVKSLALIPLADFYGIIFLSPLTVLLLSALFLKESVGWHRLLAVMTGFVGVIILAGPQFGIMSGGIAYAFIGMFLISAGIILIRKTGHDYLPLYGFYPSLFIFLYNIPFTIHDFVVPDFSTTLVFLAYSPLILAGQLLSCVGFARAPETAIVAPFHYIQMIWGVLFGYMFFSDIPSMATITGSALIIGSGLYTIWREHQIQLAINPQKTT